MTISVVQRLNQIEDLPTIPHTMQMVMEGLESEVSNAFTLQKIIEQDPSITSKILKVANSSYYSPITKISSVSRAIVMMGYDEIRSLVVSCSLAGVFPENLGFAEFGSTELWLHSIGVGIAARMIGRRLNDIDPETMFTAGMMHDLGRLVYCLYLKDEMHALLDRARAEGCSLDQAEESSGLTHGEVGAYLALRWQLGDLLIEVIHHHHHPRLAGKYARPAAVINLADALVFKAGIGWQGIGEKQEVVIPKVLKLEIETVREIYHQLKEEKEKIISTWGDVVRGR